MTNARLYIGLCPATMDTEEALNYCISLADSYSVNERARFVQEMYDDYYDLVLERITSDTHSLVAYLTPPGIMMAKMLDIRFAKGSPYR